uniref:Lipocalin-like domain-containing protein n=1 Tax=Phaeocystis antarctica TaxID=33657 RepID=A0A7S0I3N0_9EUKA
MAVSHAAAAAAGVTLGFAVGTLGFVVAKPKHPAIVGTFRREDDGSGVTGVLVYEADGRVSSHLVSRRTAAGPGPQQQQFVGYSGRWWLHNAQQAYGATYPPHDGPCVEHEVQAASSEALVGKNQVQKYMFTDNGQRLTTFTPSLSDEAPSQASSTTQHWRRI